MESPKLLNKKSDEELLKILEQAGTEVIDTSKDFTKPRQSTELKYENDVPIFLAELNIHPGDKRVRTHVFYRLYKMWSKDPINKDKFYRELSGIIPTVSGCVYLNMDTIHVKSATIKQYQDKSKKVSRAFKKKHMDDFLAYYNLKEGSTWTSAQLLGFLYDKWAHNNNRRKLAHATFTSYLELYFDKRITHNEYVYYAVSNNIRKIVQGMHNEKDWQKDIRTSKYAKRYLRAKPRKALENKT